MSDFYFYSIIGFITMGIGAGLISFAGFSRGLALAPDLVRQEVRDKYLAYQETLSEQRYLLDGETVYIVRRKPGFENAYENFRASFGQETYWMGSVSPKRSIEIKEPEQ